MFLLGNQKFFNLESKDQILFESINQLAKTVDRDFPAVQKDCNALANTGFIKFIESKKGRKTKKPVLSFPKLLIN